uniref:Coiled-coil domain-containing protein 25 n=1 Tax=Ficedula albicollis TaxID=59894 RepID=A0A803VUL4_FICAL
WDKLLENWYRLWENWDMQKTLRAQGQTVDDIPKEVLSDCAHLVKANSIQGCKLSSVTVVYTPWTNLRKTPDMDVGQIGFHRQKDVRNGNGEWESGNGECGNGNGNLGMGMGNDGNAGMQGKREWGTGIWERGSWECRNGNLGMGNDGNVGMQGKREWESGNGEWESGNGNLGNAGMGIWE